jgi:FdhE protein
VTTGTDSKILKRLQEWEEKEGSLPRLLEFYQRLLGIQSGAKSRVDVAKHSLSKEAISNRMRCGSPLLSFDDLSIDWSLLQNMFEEVTTLFTTYAEVFGEVPENLKDSSSCLTLLREITKAWFEGASLPPQMPISGVNEALLELIIHATLQPFLISHCEALLSFVNQEQWRRRYCPICGGNPDFAFLDKERGARWLLCSRCDAEWLFQRLECPYCGTKEQGALAYFTDDEGLYRLYVCERCQHYLKAIDLRHIDYEVLLPLERFLTLDIDIQAHKDRYSPCTKAGGERMREAIRGNFVSTREGR